MSKNQQYEKFEEWTKNILTQLDMPKKLHDLGITRSITQARRMVVEWNSGTWSFLCRGGVSRCIPSSRHGENSAYPSRMCVC